jgi:hypothetical protein
MAIQVQIRRGTSAENDAFTGAVGEISVDNTNKVVRVHDGSTLGGFALVGTTATQTLTNKTLSGNTTVSGNLIPSANLTYNLGSTTAWWNLVYGKSVQAQYADLAENYIADQIYPPGTVLVFGGEYEVTISSTSHDTKIAGIVSTNPAYLMNAGSGNIPVGLLGRLPCNVKGPVTKGALLVTSDIPGVAEALDQSKFQHGCILGRALEDLNESIVKIIEVVVGRV